MLVKVLGSAVYGVSAMTITIEVDTVPGSGYYIVGLPDNAVKESIDRILSVYKNNGYKSPRYKMVVNMAPADVRKAGSAYDLPIAIGMLAATEQIAAVHLEDYVLMGELQLDGSLRPVKGALPMAIQSRSEGIKGMILPVQNAREAAMVNQIEVYGVSHIQEVIALLEGNSNLMPVQVDTREEFARAQEQFDIDFSDVKGQEHIKRALEIAAAGGHNAVLIGPPGAGKTMLAKRLPTILPPLSLHEALETTKIYSVAGRLPEHASLIAHRPFRSPHHTISDAGLIGGGSNPLPGEISLAHNGVLFLDELPEFKRSVLEVLRQPMEERQVTIARAKVSIDYPAGFMLIASMNPCPCGYYNHPEKDCSCSTQMVQKYLNKVSGPLLDRIDLHVEVTPVPYEALAASRATVTSEDIRKRVVQARSIQLRRYNNEEGLHCNAQMSSRHLQAYCALDTVSAHLLQAAMKKLNLSARAYDRILKVARTIADLDASAAIKAEHIAEAIQFRSLDREHWAG